MREHLDLLRTAKLDQRFVADVALFAPTVEALINDAGTVADTHVAVLPSAIIRAG